MPWGEAGSVGMQQESSTALLDPAQAVWIDPAYDKNGNMIEGSKPGSISDGTTRYWLEYDAWNRLAQVWLDDGDGDKEKSGGEEADSLVAWYRYDGLNRRIVKLLPHGGPDLRA